MEALVTKGPVAVSVGALLSFVVVVDTPFSWFQLIIIFGDGSKPWYLVNPKIAGKWMFIPLKMYL
jgi:hypothetical protein